ncbi:MAG: MarR family winged helix-turn-helix transcriptional regulator [Deinococcota bacterium]
MHDSVLQGTQFTLLSTIAAMPQCTVSTLSDYLVMDQTTVTRSVKLLEQAGFIQFKKLKDRRKRQLIVTAQGQQALDDAYPLWLAAQEHIWAHLSEDDIKQILTLGNKLAALSKESTIK